MPQLFRKQLIDPQHKKSTGFYIMATLNFIQTIISEFKMSAPAVIQ